MRLMLRLVNEFVYKFNNIRKLFLGFAISTIIFSSCQKSTNEEIVPTATSSLWPAGTGNYATNTNVSTFTFQKVSGTVSVADSFTYTVTKDTAIDDLTYRKLESNKPALVPTYYVNYNAGVITNITYGFTIQGFTIPVVKQTVLKDNVPVNNTWSESINANVPVTLNYTLVQKDFKKHFK
jgi:hypothetical protein